MQEAGVDRPDAACFAVAGPVVDNRCALTNLKWTIDAAPLRAQLRTQAVRCAALLPQLLRNMTHCRSAAA